MVNTIFYIPNDEKQDNPHEELIEVFKLPN